MKINAGTIFGLTLIAASLLFTVWGFTARSPAPPPGSENATIAGNSNAWYFVAATGLFFSGAAFTVLSQFFKHMPSPELGSTQEDPKPADYAKYK